MERNSIQKINMKNEIRSNEIITIGCSVNSSCLCFCDSVNHVGVRGRRLAFRLDGNVVVCEIERRTRNMERYKKRKR